MPDDKGVFYHPETGEILNGIARSLLGEGGRFEYPDPIPMAPPVSFPDRSRGMRELVQQMVREEMSQLAVSMEMESFEEADDFDIPDDPVDPLTEYEKVFDPKDSAKAPEAAPQAPAGASGASGVPHPIPATSSLQATAAAPAEPIVKRSESASETVAPGSKGP